MKPITMIISAKGYSRRLPGKNVKDFCGYPLIAWSIVQGVNAESVGDVWVTTDDDEIARVSEEYGARVMFRNYKDDDETPGTVPVRKCLDRLMASGEVAEGDLFAARLCTTPHLLPHDLDTAAQTYETLRWRHGDINLGVGAKLRTFRAWGRIADNIGVNLPEEGQCNNDYSIVRVLAFLGIQPARRWIETTDPSRAEPPPSLRAAFYYEFQPWQMQDLDTPDEWEFGELVAEHYILKGRDMLNVYKRD